MASSTKVDVAPDPILFGRGVRRTRRDPVYGFQPQTLPRVQSTIHQKTVAHRLELCERNVRADWRAHFRNRCGGGASEIEARDSSRVDPPFTDELRFRHHLTGRERRLALVNWIVVATPPDWLLRTSALRPEKGPARRHWSAAWSDGINNRLQEACHSVVVHKTRLGLYALFEMLVAVQRSELRQCVEGILIHDIILVQVKAPPAELLGRRGKAAAERLRSEQEVG